jgi:hypothetical protein
MAMARHFLLKCLCQTRKIINPVFVSGVSYLPLSTIFLLNFLKVFDSVVFVVFILLLHAGMAHLNHFHGRVSSRYGTFKSLPWASV